MTVRNPLRPLVFWFCIFSTFLFFANACKDPAPKNYERIERYMDGAMKSRVKIINGKKEGLMTDYYPDGKVWGERMFQNDLQTGRTVFYFPEGQMKEVQYYIEGKKHGGDTIWYQNGQIQFTVLLENDKKNGYLRKWSPDGALVFEARYEMDTLVEVKGEPVRTRSAPPIPDTPRVHQ